PLSSGAAAAKAAKDLVQRLFDRQAWVKEEILGGSGAQRLKHLVHPRDPLQLHADPSDAPELHVLQVLVEASHLRRRAPQLHVDAARDVLGGPAEIHLLADQALLEG